MRKIPVNPGERYGRLVTLCLAGHNKRHREIWLFSCDCGNTTETLILQARGGHVHSCGCLQKEAAARQSLKMATHKLTNTPEYRAWRSMRERCRCAKHKAYSRYGGRGITVCVNWESFEAFFSDMGKRPTPNHSLDRRDNNGNYEPSNCRWATKKEQNRNRRSNRLVNYYGRTIPVSEAAELSGLKDVTLSRRLNVLCWTGDKLFSPARHISR